ncbi:hypothetical protein GJ496_010844 [Pomphorhynchus laevis]|nr:hypothetical protein GJ496_010844 [Pomphorhynchus laevis]
MPTIKYVPEFQKRLAISSSKAVLIQKRLSFGFAFAPRYFQSIMDNLIKDLPDVLVFMDDILISEITAYVVTTASASLPRRWSVGHRISLDRVSKVDSVNAVTMMPKPYDVSLLYPS